ncbi:MAG: hypothetical protein RLZZ575_713, partial [Actinomycetota bacterium]
GTNEFAPLVAKAYVTELRDLLRGLKVSDVRMEEGSLRCDVNLSLTPKGNKEWGTRTETKNVNSLRSVERAIRSEIERQAVELDKGNKIKQETRHFQEDTGSTRSGRSKEVAEEYRYFPEPDLVPIAPDKNWIEKLKSELPEQPSIRRARLAKEWGFTDLEMRDVSTLGAVDLISETISKGATPAAARKWWAGELARRASEAGIELSSLKIKPEDVARIDQLVNDGKLTDKLARQVIDGILLGEGNPDQVMEKRKLAVVAVDSALLPAINEAIAANPDAAAKIKEGKVQVVGVIVGAVMKTTGGSADAAKVRELILKTLGS